MEVAEAFPIDALELFPRERPEFKDRYFTARIQADGVFSARMAQVLKSTDCDRFFLFRIVSAEARAPKMIAPTASVAGMNPHAGDDAWVQCVPECAANTNIRDKAQVKP